MSEPPSVEDTDQEYDSFYSLCGECLTKRNWDGAQQFFLEPDSTALRQAIPLHDVPDELLQIFRKALYLHIKEAAVELSRTRSNTVLLSAYNINNAETC